MIRGLRMISLRHYEIFKTVAETGNFTKAAAKLYITQSAVSHAVRELEERAGTALFDRLARRVRLTRCGELLLAELLPLLAACGSLEGRIAALEGEAPIGVVSSITIAAFWLPGILRRFAERWPRLRVNVEVVSAANAVERLRGGGADLALVEGVPPRGAFICSAFASCRLKIVCAPGYLSAGTRLSVKEFCAERLLLRERGSAIRDVLDGALLAVGYEARPLWTSVNSLALIEAAKAGLGVAILPGELLEAALSEKRLTEIEVEGLSLRNGFFSVRHRDKYLTEPLRELLSLIEECGKAEISY